MRGIVELQKAVDGLLLFFLPSLFFSLVRIPPPSLPPSLFSPAAEDLAPGKKIIFACVPALPLSPFLLFSSSAKEFFSIFPFPLGQSARMNGLKVRFASLPSPLSFLFFFLNIFFPPPLLPRCARSITHNGEILFTEHWRPGNSPSFLSYLFLLLPPKPRSFSFPLSSFFLPEAAN